MLLMVLVLLMGFEAEASLSLKESFAAARLNMETLTRADAVILQGEARTQQAKGSVLPRVSAVASYAKIDRPQSGSINQAFTLTSQHSAALRLQQPLLRGGVWATLELAQAGELLAQFQKDASLINLYELTISAYFNLYYAQVDVNNLEELVNLSRQRVKELKERTRIGRSRRGELVEAEAQLLSSESQLKEGQAALDRAGQNFQFFTLLHPKKISMLESLPKRLDPYSDFLNKLKSRPDLLAQTQQVKLADKKVDLARGGYYPSLDLTSNYYLSRTGILENSDWDVGLSLSIPLYQGGTVSGAVREALAVKRVAQLDTARALREAERDLSILYQNYSLILEQVKSLRGALVKTEEAYHLNSQDYKNGLVTNLDVLQSLNLFIQTKRSFYGVKTQAHIIYKNLEASIGVLP
jgi:outer membrane protein